MTQTYTRDQMAILSDYDYVPEDYTENGDVLYQVYHKRNWHYEGCFTKTGFLRLVDVYDQHDE